MDLEGNILSELEKDKYHMISLICGILKKKKKEKKQKKQKSRLWRPGERLVARGGG